MRYSVTGATGLLGNNVVRHLLDQGHEVRVSVRHSSSRTPLEDLDVEILEGDIGEPDHARQLVKGTQALIHAAGLIWFGKTQQASSRKINVTATQNLAEACADQNSRLLFVSSTDALAAGSPSHPANESSLDPPKCNAAYVVSKREAEAKLFEMAPHIGLDFVITNPCLFFGPWDWKPSSGKMILALTDGFVPLAPSGGISVGDVRNIANGIIAAVQKGRHGERYILAGTNLSYLELWRHIAGLVNRKGPFAAMRTPMKKILSFGGDLFTSISKRETEVNSEAIKLGGCWNYYDSSKAEGELDYQTGDYKTAIQDAWEWLRTNGYSKHKH